MNDVTNSFTVMMPDGNVFDLDLTPGDNNVRQTNLAIVEQQCIAGRTKTKSKKSDAEIAAIFLVHRYLDYLGKPNDDKIAAILKLNADFIKGKTGAIGVAYWGDLYGTFAMRFIFDEDDLNKERSRYLNMEEAES